VQAVRVQVVTSEGTKLGTYTVRKDGTIHLTDAAEVTIWGESARRLHRALDHMDAMRSGELHWNGTDSTPRLKDGTPLKGAVLEEWAARHGFRILRENGVVVGLACP